MDFLPVLVCYQVLSLSTLQIINLPERLLRKLGIFKVSLICKSSNLGAFSSTVFREIANNLFTSTSFDIGFVPLKRYLAANNTLQGVLPSDLKESQLVSLVDL